MRHLPIQMMVFAAVISANRCCFSQSPSDYPSKPVRIVVPSAPGGSIDVTPRLITGKLSESLKTQFVVENRPGGGGIIGIGYVAKSAPDGYTLLATGPVFTIAPALFSKASYASTRDFAPVSLVTTAPYLLLVHPSLPVKSIKDFVALARAKPRALDFGVGFNGSLTHLAAAYFASATGIRVTLVPFKGSGEVITSVLGGQIHAMFGNILPVLSHVKSGRLRALAVASPERSSVLPDLPTAEESGVPGFRVASWHGWLAPAGTPPAIVNKLNVEIAKAVKSPEIAKVLTDGGTDPVGSSVEQFQQLIAMEVARWSKVVKDSGMRVE